MEDIVSYDIIKKKAQDLLTFYWPGIIDSGFKINIEEPIEVDTVTVTTCNYPLDVYKVKINIHTSKYIVKLYYYTKVESDPVLMGMEIMEDVLFKEKKT